MKQASTALQGLRTQAVGLVRRIGARAYLALALVFSLLIVGDTGILELLRGAETRLFDTLISHRFVKPGPDPDIVIIDIDEASLAGMAAKYGRWPWPNRVLGELVSGIEAQKPRAIVFDILFSDRDALRPESDADFNAVIARSGSTFFPMLRLDPQNDKLSKIPTAALPGVRPAKEQPDADATIAIILPKVPAAIDNGRLGTHQVVPDRDGVIRRYPTWIEHAGWRIPSLPQRIAEEFHYEGSDKPEILINWRGPPFTYRYLSFVEVYRDLTGGAKQQPVDEFAGKIVIIGSTAPSLFDIKATPLARIHPGVEILATAIDNFKHGDALRERPAWVMMAAALLLIWSMAIALYRQIRIEVFDAVFGVLQGTLVLIAFVVLNASTWYLDTSAPLSLGALYFTVARIYYGLSRKWLARSQVQNISALDKGARLLGVLAIRLDHARPSARRRLKGDIDRLVARSKLGAGRIANLVEDPGFVQSVFADVMLVYWLCEDTAADWASDAAAIEAALAQKRSHEFNTGRLRFARSSDVLRWERANGWTAQAFQIILSALAATTNSAHKEETHQ